MHCDNLYLYERLMNLRAEEERRRAELFRLARQMRGQGPRRLPQRCCLLLYRLGGLLVAAGRRLEGYGRTRRQPIRGGIR